MVAPERSYVWTAWWSSSGSPVDAGQERDRPGGLLVRPGEVERTRRRGKGAADDFLGAHEVREIRSFGEREAQQAHEHEEEHQDETHGEEGLAAAGEHEPEHSSDHGV
jgi:hypothetical protein